MRSFPFAATLVRALALVAAVALTACVEERPEKPSQSKAPAVDTTKSLRAPEKLFDPYGLHHIDFTIAPDLWAAYLAAVENPSKATDDIWYPAHATIDGTHYLNAGLKAFGRGSQILNPAKANIRVKFDKFDDALEGPEGLHNLRLKAAGQDPTFLREPLTNELLRVAGGLAPQWSWAQVAVNGQALGFYLLLEHIDKRTYDAYFGNKAGNVYEPLGGCIGLNCPASGCDHIKSYYEADPGDYQTLEALVTAIAQAPDAELFAAVDPLVDLDRLLALYAVEAVVSNYDGLASAGHNYEIYQDETTGRLEFFGRSMDLSLGVWEVKYPLFTPWGEPNTWCKGHVDRFYERALVVAGIQEKLMGKFRALQCGPFATQNAKAWLRDLRSRVRPLAASEPKATFTPAEEEASYLLLEKYVGDRGADLEKLLGKCPAPAR